MHFEDNILLAKKLIIFVCFLQVLFLKLIDVYSIPTKIPAPTLSPGAASNIAKFLWKNIAFSS